MRTRRSAVRAMIAATGGAMAVALVGGCAPKPEGTVTGTLTYSAIAETPATAAATRAGTPVASQSVVIYLNGEVIAEGETGVDGIYSLQAPPGEYTVDADTCAPQDGPDVAVESSKTVRKNMICVIP